MYAGVGCGVRFRKVPKGSSWKVPEGSGEFRRVLVEVPEAGFGRFGACWCGFGRQGSEGCGEFRGGLLPCNFDRSSHVIILITGTTLSTWAKPQCS